jgi:hypothetical protein
MSMGKTPPNLADLPREVEALFAAQAAELSGLKQEFLGASLDHATAQKGLKHEMGAVLSARPMRAPSRTETLSSQICACNFTGTKNTVLAQSQKTARSWRWS